MHPKVTPGMAGSIAFPEIMGKEDFEALSPELRNRYTRDVLQVLGFVYPDNVRPPNRWATLQPEAVTFLQRLLTANTLEGRWQNRYYDDAEEGASVMSLTAYTADWFDIYDIANDLLGDYPKLTVKLPKHKSISRKDDVISFAIYPTYLQDGKKVLQAGGADRQTVSYDVYKRFSNGDLEWHDEWCTEAEAITCVETLSRFTGLPIEIYEWMKFKVPSLAEGTAAFEECVKNQHFLKSIEKDQHGTYAYAPTQQAKVVWDAACEWMQSAFAAQR